MSTPSPTTCRHVAALVLAATLWPAAAAAAAGPGEAAFIPRGFDVEKRIDADIGGDVRRDRVLVLVARRRPGLAPDAQPSRARRLVVLKARSDGGYVQIGDGRRLLLCTRCGGAFFGVATTPVTVRVVRRVIVVEQELGSRELTFQRFRLRAEGVSDTRLTDVLVRVTDRLTGVTNTRRIDLLSGREVRTRSAPGGRPSVTTTRRPPRRLLLEQADWSKFL